MSDEKQKIRGDHQHTEPIVAWGIVEFGPPEDRAYTVVALTPSTFRPLTKGDKLLGIVPAAPDTTGVWAKASLDDDYDSLVAVSFDGGESHWSTNDEYAERKMKDYAVARKRDDPMVG